MKYSTANPNEAEAAREYLNQLIEGKKTVEIKRVIKRRTINQNSYLHLLLNAFGLHFGYTTQEAKVLYKRLNKDIYAYEKGTEVFFRSSADLDTQEMTKSIERFRQFSAEQDYPLPLATDEAALMSLGNAIEQAQHYL